MYGLHAPAGCSDLRSETSHLINSTCPLLVYARIADTALQTIAVLAERHGVETYTSMQTIRQSAAAYLSPFCGFRPVTITFAPRAASDFAADKPSPDVPPVINIVLPV